MKINKFKIILIIIICKLLFKGFCICISPNFPNFENIATMWFTQHEFHKNLARRAIRRYVHAFPFKEILVYLDARNYKIFLCQWIRNAVQNPKSLIEIQLDWILLTCICIYTVKMSSFSMKIEKIKLLNFFILLNLLYFKLKSP